VHVDPGPEEIACWTAILRSDFEVTEVQQSPFTDTSCIVTLEAPHDTNWYGPKSCSKMVGTCWDLNLQGIFQSSAISKETLGTWSIKKKSKIARATPVNQSSYCCDVISKVLMSSWSATISVNNQRDPSWRFECSTQSNDISIYFLYARWSKNNHSTKSKLATLNV